MSAISVKEKRYFQKVISSKFASLLGVELMDVKPDSVTLKISIDAEKHINALNVVQGGVIMTIADIAMGCICFNLEKEVSTIDFNINFIKSAQPSGFIKATGTVIHNGSKTMVTEAEVYDSEDKLIAKARGTFFVIGKFEQ